MYSSEDDTRGTRSSISTSSLRTSLRKARDRLKSRGELVQDVMARLRYTRDTLHQDASPYPKGHGRDAKATTMSLRRTTSNHAGGRCDIPTPKQSPVSRPCTATEEMPSSVESGAGPSIRGGSWGTKRRVHFAVDIDGESDALGWRSKGCVAMQTRIATRKKERDRERAQAAGRPARGSSTSYPPLSSNKPHESTATTIARRIGRIAIHRGRVVACRVTIHGAMVRWLAMTAYLMGDP